MTKPKEVTTQINEIASILLAAGIKNWTPDQFKKVDRALAKIIAARVPSEKSIFFGIGRGPEATGEARGHNNCRHAMLIGKQK